MAKITVHIAKTLAEMIMPTEIKMILIRNANLL